MKNHTNSHNAIKKFVLVGLIVVISLFGLILDANAQSTLLGKDLDKINISMVVQMADYDFDIMIPKVSSEELKTLDDVAFNQMVYVTDGASGYYFYLGTKWELQKVSEVFELIDMNLAIQKPNAESLIIMADEGDSNALLDYNHHVKSIYQDFGFDKQENVMAINIKK
ncbi:hypothetical protein [Marivirga sp.]|uniref:hypothetical protein n=1 Tax=Marivirga sp. TaxID=2018662 RepID=UPI002D809A45|nr:hypothetical protein [Marivirga sp.]HET8859934.1 hypothetical protein [Marivirga sp.]